MISSYTRDVIGHGVIALVAASSLGADCPTNRLISHPANGFGYQAAVRPDWIAVSDGSKKVFFFEPDGAGGWINTQKQNAGNPGPLFEGAMAFFGDRLLVGAPIDATGDSGQGRLFLLQDGVWTFEADIPPVPPGGDTFLGTAVALSDQFAFLGGQDLDYIHVFLRNNNSWSELAHLEQTPGFGGWFGISMSLDNDNDRLAVGSVRAGFSTVAGVEIFELLGGSWISTAIVLNDSDPGFASSTGVSGDWLAVGSSDQNVYLYHQDSPGTWSLIQTISAVDPDGVSFFGASMAMPNDSMLIVSGVSGGQGAAYRFARNVDDVWIQQAIAVNGGGRAKVASDGITGVVTVETEGIGAATFDLTCIDDCNGNGVADQQDLYAGTSQDCNGNTIPDDCDIAAGTSLDVNGNGVPDECDPLCEADLNADRKIDLTDLAIFLIHYGECSGDPDFFAPADLDGRGCVGLEDLAILLADYGNVCD